jgi:hypothetical protein
MRIEATTSVLVAGITKCPKRKKKRSAPVVPQRAVTRINDKFIPQCNRNGCKYPEIGTYEVQILEPLYDQPNATSPTEYSIIRAYVVNQILVNES